MVGASKIRQLRDGPDVVVVVTAATFIAMLSVFTYVDIAWDARNMALLGVAHGHVCELSNSGMTPHGSGQSGQGCVSTASARRSA